MESDTQYSATTDPAIRVLREEVESLRALLVGLLVIIILFSGGINIYLRDRSYTVSREAAAEQKFVDDYNTIGAPSARDLWFRLNQYARTHPDFQPVIARYTPYITTSGAKGAVPQ